MRKEHRDTVTFWGVLTITGSILAAIVWLFVNWNNFSMFMMRTNFLYKSTPAIYWMVRNHTADSLYDAAITRKIDSLETVVRLMSFGKYPYRDSIQYLNKYWQWEEVDIRDHPEMKKYHIGP